MPKVRQAAKGSCLFTEMTEAQVDWLDVKFARFTEVGWFIPEWIKELRREVQIRALITAPRPPDAVN